MRRHTTPGRQALIPVPLWKDPDATFETSPLPRHRARRMLNARPTSRANHPTYHHHDLHLVNNDDHHTSRSLDDDRSRTRGANVSPTAGPDARGDHAMPGGDHGPHSQVLGPVRTRDRAVGDRDRLAGIELSTRRREPHWLLLDLPARTPVARRSPRWRRLPGLVLRAIQCGTEHRGRRCALCVLGIITLATLIGQVR